MRTNFELNAKLSEERIWRVRECSSIVELADRAPQGTTEREIHLRSGTVLFYSHFEGFIKRAATYYLKFISHQRIAIRDMSPFVLRLYVRQQVQSSSAPDRFEKLAQRVLSEPNLCPKLPYKKQIDTESNLSSKVLRAICDTVGVSFSNFEPMASDIDSILLKNRHAVAHGERGSDLTFEVLEQTKDLVIALISLFKDEIENNALSMSFKI